MKPKNPLLLFAALLALLITLPGYAQQANTNQSVTLRILELPAEFRNAASFVEWSYISTDSTLRIGDQPSGVIMIHRKWDNPSGKNVFLPLGLNASGRLNLQFNPCYSGESVWWEPYNDSASYLLVDESVLGSDFNLTLYTDDDASGGAGAKLVLSAADFAQARAIDMIALAAPAESFGKVSGITSSLPDQYNILAEDLGGLWLGLNGLPARGVGLNQGERFTSAQVPPCQPAGPEFANDLGDAVVLLPRETACAPGRVTLWEDDLDNRPSGSNWPITLGPDLCEDRPRDEDEGTTWYLPLIAGPAADRAGDESSCTDGQLVITNEFGTYRRPLDSESQLTVPNLPYTSATTITIEGAQSGRFVQYSPAYTTTTGLSFGFPGGHPGAEWRVEIFSEVGGQQCHASLRANIDP